ncbi:inositol monophosphatase family protein [Sphingosinicella rhizophila]|uniref:Inositol monophosphatase family protein n=1 Tax=Sphingosinicella rhizophila TaxID=3050082 RepID=A0ABU3Q2Z4_9SPHN|nr:inositol monophosphatase family protein [Sphingosinicella sp. GR2756]MDT9597340.1 inositol monophosphatase family protein [Sphingosinicella sp. GR2756]
MSRSSQFLTFARELAEAARLETLPGSSGDMAARNKGGAAYDPVTDADVAAEQAMRRLIEARYPDHGVSGEELPDRPSQNGLLWSLDPIDGTRSYICGLPTWVTLIGLLDEGRPSLGAIDVPRLDEFYIGCGDTSFLHSGGRETLLSVSGCRTVAEARFAATDPFMFHGEDADKVERIRGKARVTRFGHDGYAYARLAAGALDLVVESGLKTYDYNALIPVIRGAGGVFGDWQGGEAYEGGRVIAAATQQLFDEALDLLKR